VRVRRLPIIEEVEDWGSEREGAKEKKSGE